MDFPQNNKNIMRTLNPHTILNMTFFFFAKQ